MEEEEEEEEDKTERSAFQCNALEGMWRRHDNSHPPPIQ